jgi:hypothetical protein
VAEEGAAVYHCGVVDRGDGSYRVEYTPLAVGLFSASLCINGHAVGNAGAQLENVVQVVEPLAIPRSEDVPVDSEDRLAQASALTRLTFEDAKVVRADDTWAGHRLVPVRRRHSFGEGGLQ